MDIALRSADYLAADGGGGNPGEGEDAGEGCVFLPEARGQGREVLVTNGYQDGLRHGAWEEDRICGGGDMIWTHASDSRIVQRSA